MTQRLLGLLALSGRSRLASVGLAGLFFFGLTACGRPATEADCQLIVAAAVTVLFGADYSTRQLRRDLQDS